MAFFASVSLSAMREIADGSIFPSAIAATKLLFSHVRERDCARICMLGRPICSITDGETDAVEEMIQAQSGMKKNPDLSVFSRIAEGTDA
jgi:hypothetical protein